MIKELKGNNGDAKIFTDLVDETTINQVKEILDSPLINEKTKVRIMPDCHAGAGCVIGTTITINGDEEICPNIVGVDIGCGMLCYNMGKVDIDLKLFDDACHSIPSGLQTHIETNEYYDYESRWIDQLNDNGVDLEKLNCYDSLKNIERLIASIGSLGGGNHFIELDKDDENNIYLVIHSGSRNLGKQVAEYYQNLAIKNCSYEDEQKNEIENLINDYKANNRQREIQNGIKEIKEKYSSLTKLPKDLCYLDNYHTQKYLEDMKICQDYASLNRKTILLEILRTYGNLHNQVYRYNQVREEFNNIQDNCFETIHNYINFYDCVLRKGAVSSKKGEKLIIPMNMRDGSLLCTGLGNEDWNNSAPHGAGRILSRTQAKEKITIDEFKKSMNGIYSTTICEETIDESAMAYKPMGSIIEAIKDTVVIDKIIKPIYNFKASE